MKAGDLECTAQPVQSSVGYQVPVCAALKKLGCSLIGLGCYDERIDSPVRSSAYLRASKSTSSILPHFDVKNTVHIIRQSWSTRGPASVPVSLTRWPVKLSAVWESSLKRSAIPPVGTRL